ncbi:MAG: Spermidine/putrescine import ABC transporter ATP-binding protein PotA [uncultured Chloroflexi bacterium]|uniref:Spermidine/putrescine import ABC transporter ATP-binding protein PotA n=1 Tax=uncultured Chloroflexota bacterium TaxID=166587 RepID=A0A6J4JVQ2_9CHLR|nr:MAG: Spermidine/putrescine import ABC transporter ATP-binding protein PotA [uncultured Chloroflexota bacterium]
MTYLVLERVVKQFPSRDAAAAETAAVDYVSLSIERGEMVTLLGPSGCGKTTTLRMIAGFETPTEGRIVLDGQEIQGLPAHKRGMAMVFQSYALFPHLSVYENVAYGLRVRRRPDAEVRQRVGQALELVNLGGLENRAPNQLSGGQQQRVALARALVVQPAVLLFDEPLSNLDATLREQMRFQIRQLQQRLGITAVYVTHDQAEAMVLSDRVVVMNRGKIRQVGPPTEVYRRPAERFVAAFLGRANFLPARTVDLNGTLATAGSTGATDAGGKVGGTSSGVEVAGVRFPARGPSAPPAGTDVTVVLRPESVTVEPRTGGHAPEGTLSGTVQRAAFLGSVVEYEVLLDSAEPGGGAPSGPLVAVHDGDPNRDEPLSAGALVALRPLARELYFLPTEAAG